MILGQPDGCLMRRRVRRSFVPRVAQDRREGVVQPAVTTVMETTPAARGAVPPFGASWQLTPRSPTVLDRAVGGRSSVTSAAPSLLIASPRPVPPYLLAVLDEAWENSWNSLSICSAVIPPPVSVTVSVTQPLPFSCLW